MVGNLPLRTMSNGLPFGTCTNSHHSIKHMVFPSIVIWWLDRMFLCCCILVAHRQFHGAYGPLLSLRSIECAGDGRLPMSRRNTAKSASHSGQTEIPLPPYLLYAGSSGFEHLKRICSQVRYSELLVKPCLKLMFSWPLSWLRSIVFSLVRQPQEVSRFGRAVMWLDVPQLHLHSHSVAPHGSVPTGPMTVNLPNVLPLKSIRGAISNWWHNLAKWSTP